MIFKNWAFLLLGLISLSGCGWSTVMDQSDAVSSLDTHSVLDLGHPRKATAHATETLLLGYEQPSVEDILACQKKIKDIAERATSDYEIVAAKLALKSDIMRDRATYHWCFYQTVNQLDRRLEASAAIDKKAKYFYDKMKELWPLARALDDTDETTEEDEALYFTYLRSRYMEISVRVFGRNLEVVGDPIDRGRPRAAPTSRGAPAVGDPAPGSN